MTPAAPLESVIEKTKAALANELVMSAIATLEQAAYSYEESRDHAKAHPTDDNMEVVNACGNALNDAINGISQLEIVAALVGAFRALPALLAAAERCRTMEGATQPWQPTHRHKKRGSVYRLWPRAAYCAAHDLDMQACGDSELWRINRPAIIEKIRAKQAAKPTGSALPVSSTLLDTIAQLRADLARVTAERDGLNGWAEKLAVDADAAVAKYDLYIREAGDGFETTAHASEVRDAFMRIRDKTRSALTAREGVK